MSSQAPRFCSQCFMGTLRGDIEPTGTVETIAGLPTYVARPEAGKQPAGIVVIIPDAVGWELRNTRVLADSYARRIPALVLLPEFMNGHALPAESLAAGDRLMNPNNSWWYRNLVLRPIWFLQMLRYFIPLAIAVRPSVAKPRIDSYLQSLRTNPPPPFATTTTTSPTTITTPKIAAAGFCWGGKYTILLTHDSSLPLPLIDCAFTAHPSFISLPDDIARVHKPLSLANGDHDMMMPGDRMVLCKRLLDAKPNCEAVVYEGAVHGFAVRGDPNDPRQAEMGLRAEDQAVRWFRMHFGSG